jgi:hypothetical protein
MASLRRAFVIAVAALALGAAAPLAAPSPPAAQANVVCDSPLPGPEDVIDVAGGAIGIGNPITDVCEAVTDPILGLPGKALDPLKDAAGSIGKGIFNQVTAWVADGAVWLIGEVAVLTDRTTTPNLLSKGFLRQYRLMALIASFMAALMAIFCVFEAIGRGDAGLLWRVFLINVPLAAIATSAAYVVVQLLIATCDGMCLAISQSAGADSKEFFQGAIKALAQAGASPGAVVGAATGAHGVGPNPIEASEAVAVPLFVGFIAAIVAAFAAFFVWIELLMRDAAIYVVALFMPLALAASIWPRWVSALRRTCELLIVIIFSKFVIVAIVSLAASLLAKNEGAVEHVLAAGAMLLLACFSPFVLFKLVPFAEGAVSSAFGRQSASGGAVRTVEFANSMMMVHQLSRRNWDAASGGGGNGGGGSSGKPSGAGKGGPGGGGSAGQGAGAGAAASGAVPVAAAGAEAAKGAKGAGERLGQSGVGEEAGSAGGGQGSTPAASGRESTPRPSPGAGQSGSTAGERAGSSGESAGETSPRPSAPEPQEAGGGPAAGQARPPRPAAERGSSMPKGGEA